MAASLSLSDAVNLYLDSRQGRCSPKTVEQDAYVMRRLVRHIGDIQVRNVRPEHVERFFNTLTIEHRAHSGITYQPVAASTYNNLYSRIKQFAAWLQKRGLTRADFMEYVSPRKVERTVRLQPSTAILLQLIDVPVDPRDRAVLAIASNTALRANEIRGLRVRDVDLATLTLRVRISKSRQEDDMPITADLERELRDWLTAYAQWQQSVLGRAIHDDDCLIPARRGPRYRWVLGDDGTKQRIHTDGGYDPLRPADKLHRIAQEALAALGYPTKGEGIHTFRRATARAPTARALFDRLVEAPQV